MWNPQLEFACRCQCYVVLHRVARLGSVFFHRRQYEPSPPESFAARKQHKTQDLTSQKL
jgi:hypothetical protein